MPSSRVSAFESSEDPDQLALAIERESLRRRQRVASVQFAVSVVKDKQWYTALVVWE